MDLDKRDGSGYAEYLGDLSGRVAETLQRTTLAYMSLAQYRLESIPAVCTDGFHCSLDNTESKV